MEPKTFPEDTMPEVLASEIEGIMKHWGEPLSSERQRFEKARSEFQPCAEKIASAAAATERLDAKDFAFRINATR